MSITANAKHAAGKDTRLRLTRHRPEWTTAFADERDKLRQALQDEAVSIEHIGSTAIPGICAKPVIDMLIGVRDLRHMTPERIRDIEALGYCYVSDYEQAWGLPHRRFFRKDDAVGRRSHHIHLVHHESAWRRRHLLFRDYLRTHAASAKRYEALKLALATALNITDLPAAVRERLFYRRYILPDTELAREYRRLRQARGERFTVTHQYALAKSPIVREIETAAYFDFDLHRPDIASARLNGYVPQAVCLSLYRRLFQDAELIRCFGAALGDERIDTMPAGDASHWDCYRFGAYVWFDKTTNEFVGRGGLRRTEVAGREETELAYALMPAWWGNGLAVEIGKMAVKQAFQALALRDIVCFTMHGNRRSLRVIEKLGFRYERDITYGGFAHRLFRLTA